MVGQHKSAATIVIGGLGSHVLELLERADLNGSRGWFSLEHHFFLGEWIDSLAGFHRRLAHGGDLHQAGKDELADGILLQVAFNDVTEIVENCRDLLAGKFGVFRDLIEDLGLGITLFDCCGFLSHGEGIHDSA